MLTSGPDVAACSPTRMGQARPLEKSGSQAAQLGQLVADWGWAESFELQRRKSAMRSSTTAPPRPPPSRPVLPHTPPNGTLDHWRPPAGSDSGQWRRRVGCKLCDKSVSGGPMLSRYLCCRSCRLHTRETRHKRQQTGGPQDCALVMEPPGGWHEAESPQEPS